MSALEHLDWSLVQSFLAVAETGSLSAGGRRLRLTQPTVGRHVQSLEQDLGVSLFKRQARGMTLTEHGTILLNHAHTMREAAEAFSLHAAGTSSDLRGTVRITASVFASHHYLPEIIAGLRETNPDVDIELVPSDETENLLFREADIAVRMYRPTQLDMVTQHLGDVQLGLFGAKRYLDRRGRPQKPEDLFDHDIVGYDRNENLIRGFRDAGFEIERDFFPVRCDNHTAVWELVRAGCGLGFAPVRAGVLDPNLEYIDLGLQIPRLEAWLTAHEAIRKNPHVDLVWRALATGMRTACDPPPS